MIGYLAQISNELEKIDNLKLQTEKDFEHQIDKKHVSQKQNAINLLHSLVLQRLDVSLL